MGSKVKMLGALGIGRELEVAGSFFGSLEEEEEESSEIFLRLEALALAWLGVGDLERDLDLEPPELEVFLLLPVCLDEDFDLELLLSSDAFALEFGLDEPALVVVVEVDELLDCCFP